MGDYSSAVDVTQAVDTIAKNIKGTNVAERLGIILPTDMCSNPTLCLPWLGFSVINCFSKPKFPDLTFEAT